MIDAARIVKFQWLYADVTEFPIDYFNLLEEFNSGSAFGEGRFINVGVGTLVFSGSFTLGLVHVVLQGRWSLGGAVGSRGEGILIHGGIQIIIVFMRPLRIKDYSEESEL